MIEVPNIQQGGLSEITSELPQSTRREEMFFDKKSKPTKLRPGEIVQGTIIEVHANDEATVRLPNGTYRAVLHGALKRGDTLFFKVVESAPTLILRIYAVYCVINGKKVSNKDIIRILNLPEKIYTDQIISFYSFRRSIIVRDDILVFLRLFDQIDSKELEDTPIKDLFKVLFLMHESNLPFSKELYKKIKPMFIGINYLQAAMALLDQYKFYMPDPLQKRLEHLFNRLKDPDTDLMYLFNYFSIRNQSSDKQITFYSLLRQFLNIEYSAKKNPEMFNLQTIVKNLVEAIEAQHIMNSFAHRNKTPKYFFVPIFIWDNYFIAQLAIKKEKNNTIMFSILTFNDELGEVLTQGNYNDKKINTIFISESEESSSILQKHLMALRRVLYSKNYDAGALKATNMPIEEIDMIQDRTQQQPKKISVVI
jgi:hypothetical protein